MFQLERTVMNPVQFSPITGKNSWFQKVKWFIQGYWVNQWQRWNQHFGLLTSESGDFPIHHVSLLISAWSKNEIHMIWKDAANYTYEMIYPLKGAWKIMSCHKWSNSPFLYFITGHPCVPMDSGKLNTHAESYLKIGTMYLGGTWETNHCTKVYIQKR